MFLMNFKADPVCATILVLLGFQASTNQRFNASMSL
jgi:hypothetical protein